MLKNLVILSCWAERLPDAVFGAGLQELCLNSCTHLSHKSLAHLIKASRLSKLDLSHCKWVEDQDLAVLKEYAQLRELSLMCCPAITSKGVSLQGRGRPQSLFPFHNSTDKMSML